MPRTTLRSCGTCKARIIWAATPAGKRVMLDHAPDDTGTWAAQQTAAGAWLARQLSQGEKPQPGVEKRYACHWVTRPTCKPLTDRQRAVRAEARAAVRSTLRDMRSGQDRQSTESESLF